MKIVQNPRFLHLFFQEEIYAIPSQEPAMPDETALPQDLPEEKTYKLLLLGHSKDQARPFSQSEQSFLSNVLKAVSLNPEDVCLYNLGHEPDAQSWAKLKHIPAPYVLVLGDFLKEATSREQYRLHPYHNAQRVLAHTLSEIEADRQKKRKLWTVLQEMFLKS